VVDEISRGIRLASDITVIGPVEPGWVRLNCVDPTMAEWMLRAVIMENISCRLQDAAIDVPAGPQYRVEKEIKNVITSIAKTSHYWNGHMWRAQREEIRRSFDAMAAESPLVQPTPPGVECGPTREAMAAEIHTTTGLSISSRRYSGWLGVECASVKAAVWMMRVLTAMNVLARREDTTLFVPVNPVSDPGGRAVATAVGRVHRYAQAQSVN
jgi:sirohydrochlorin cobaltochelatase